MCVLSLVSKVRVELNFRFQLSSLCVLISISISSFGLVLATTAVGKWQNKQFCLFRHQVPVSF